jgi:hypothetical protein
MAKGDFVRHRARPEWGIGQVLVRTEDRIDVQFAHGLVPLKLSVAAPHLESVSASEAAAAGAGTTTTRRQGPASTASAPRRTKAKKAAAAAPEAEDE